MKVLQILSLICAGAMFAGTGTVQAALPTFGDVKDSAKKDKKYVVVIWAGTDWSSKSRMVAKEAEALSQKSKEPVLWCMHDEKEVLTPEEQKRPKPPGEVYNIPAVQVVSPDGHMVFMQEGVSKSELPKVLDKAFAAIKKQEKANGLWEKAKQAKGAEAAKLYHDGLKLLPRYAINGRKDILNELKKADPEDTAGYHFKHTFNYLGFIEGIQKQVAAKPKINNKPDQQEAHALVDKRLAIDSLSPLERQHVMAAKFWLYRNEGKKAEALKVLQDIAKISPKTIMGKGATYYYKYLNDPVVLKEPHFTGWELRPEFTPTRVNVSKMLDGPGTYAITFKANGGGAQIRNVRFMKGNTVVSELPKNKQDKNSYKFQLNLPDNSKPDLVFDCRGTGWFSWDGDIIVTKES